MTYNVGAEEMRGASNLDIGGSRAKYGISGTHSKFPATILYYKAHSMVRQNGPFPRRPRINMMAVEGGIIYCIQYGNRPESASRNT